MKKKRINRQSILNARSVSTVSVALVLLILGIVGITTIAAHNLTDRIKQNLGFDIVIAEDTPDADVASLLKSLADNPGVSSAELFSADDAMARWREETGEDVIEILGVNPFASEIDVKIVPAMAHRDSIARLADRFRSIPCVEEITVHTDMVDSINRNLHTILLVMGIIAAALLLISAVLINNTVRLTVYSRRFIIHTMKLVGATAGFIRAPFIRTNALAGLVAGLMASAVMLILILYTENSEPSLAPLIPWPAVALVCAAMTAGGVALCALCALFSTNRYLRLGYDSLFD